MGDLISREALIDFLLNVPFLIEHGLLQDLVIDWVNQQPPVEAAPVVHGEWKFHFHSAYVCSNCVKEVDYKGMSNFCPNCGADMRKKVQE